MCIDCDCGGLREREREHDERVRVRETAERERYTYRAKREKKHKQFSINFACGLRRLRLLHLAWWRTEREGGRGERKWENATLIGVERETNNFNLLFMHQFDCGGCRKSNNLAADGVPRERQETRLRSGREYLTSRIIHNIQLINREKRVLIWIAILFNTQCRKYDDDVLYFRERCTPTW